MTYYHQLLLKAELATSRREALAILAQLKLLKSLDKEFNSRAA